jgi:hypothetical protein
MNTTLRVQRIGRRALLAAIAGALLSVITSPALAQDAGSPNDAEFVRLSDKLKAGESIVITTQDGKRIEGRFVDVSLARIAVSRDDERQEVVAQHVTRVQVRRNGMLFGPVIGALAGLGFGLALGSALSNEGGSAGVGLALGVGVGAGAGLAIDALLVRPRTVFERTSEGRSRLSFVVTPTRAQAQARVRF